jgi:hypothetical protein
MFRVITKNWRHLKFGKREIDKTEIKRLDTIELNSGRLEQW